MDSTEEYFTGRLQEYINKNNGLIPAEAEKKPNLWGKDMLGALPKLEVQADVGGGEEGDEYASYRNDPVGSVALNEEILDAVKNYAEAWSGGIEVIKDDPQRYIEEASEFFIDVLMGISNAIDKNAAFGIGNKIREYVFKADEYTPFNKDVYEYAGNAGEIASIAMNIAILYSGVSGLFNAARATAELVGEYLVRLNLLVWKGK